mgnify:CR=1 FL=1
MCKELNAIMGRHPGWNAWGKLTVGAQVHKELRKCLMRVMLGANKDMVEVDLNTFGK